MTGTEKVPRVVDLLNHSRSPRRGNRPHWYQTRFYCSLCLLLFTNVISSSLTINPTPKPFEKRLRPSTCTHHSLEATSFHQKIQSIISGYNYTAWSKIHLVWWESVAVQLLHKGLVFWEKNWQIQSEYFYDTHKIWFHLFWACEKRFLTMIDPCLLPASLLHLLVCVSISKLSFLM